VILLRIEGPAARLREQLRPLCEGMPSTEGVKAQLLDYQQMALFALARQFDRKGARILEIGTGHGSSGLLLAKAAPRARIVSLTVSPSEKTIAERWWASHGCSNITARVQASWDLLPTNIDTWDLIWLDGDHNRITRDLPWFDHVNAGGLFVCHDYSPQDSRSPSAIVFAELNAMAERLGRPFDVRVVDDGKIGMAGWYREAGERHTGRVVTPPAAEPIAPAPTPPAIEPERLAKRAPIVPLRAHATGCGIVQHQDDERLRHQAAAHGWSVVVAHGWDTPWPQTLFVGAGVAVPWDLLPAGFGFLDRWDIAAPFTREVVLAQDVSTPEDRGRTEAIVRDLRMPLYEPGLLFVRRQGAGLGFLARWRVECEAGDDERLAFLRALFLEHPHLCALPRIWLAPQAERDAINRRSPSPSPSVVRTIRRHH
jgi:predicted O-methyltransferase YrrM